MKTLIDSAICRDRGVVYGINNSVVLKEHDSIATLKELVVSGVPEGAVVADLDPVEGIGKGKKVRLKRYSWFFLDSHPIATKQCDGAIFANIDGKESLIMIEMKSSISGLQKGRKQLKAGVAFSKYIACLLGRDICVHTRLIYIGPPIKSTAMGKKAANMPEHAEIPVSVTGGRSVLSFHSLCSG